MSETFHASAIVMAAVGACCGAADRARVRPPEIAAAALMLLVMLDSTVFRVLTPVGGTALLLVGALALAVWRRPRQRRTPRVPIAMTVHTTLGMVTMAALQIGMAGHSPSGGAVQTHAHGVGLGFVIGTAVVCFLALSVGVGRRMPARLDRSQIGAMAASVALMGVAAL